MQIVTSPSGVAVDAVRLGSAADSAGIEPGDVITGVAGRPINTVPQIRGATTGVKLGSHVSIQIQRDTSMITAAVTMKERPTIHQ